MVELSKLFIAPIVCLCSGVLGQTLFLGLVSVDTPIVILSGY